MPGSLNAGVVDPNGKFAVGGQREYGVKTSMLEGRFTASVAYFEIEQKNTSVTNSEFFRLQSLGDFVVVGHGPLGEGRLDHRHRPRPKILVRESGSLFGT